MKAPFAPVLLLAALNATLAAQSAPRQPASDSSAVLSRGKAIFVSRCASCHDENGIKILADGTTLLARLAQSKDPEARLGTRLKDREERHQVMVYMQTMLDRFPASASSARTH